MSAWIRGVQVRKQYSALQHIAGETLPLSCQITPCYNIEIAIFEVVI